MKRLILVNTETDETFIKKINERCQHNPLSYSMNRGSVIIKHLYTKKVLDIVKCPKCSNSKSKFKYKIEII